MSFEKKIFINCPFDDAYRNNFLKPILYIIIRNGFTAALSLEDSDSGRNRLEKIISFMKNCKYSIHDLSLIKFQTPEEFARMNMPFELGIDYGLRNSGLSPFDTKKFLILGASRFDYMKAISDLNGVDIKAHNDNVQQLFNCLYAWFSETLKIYGQSPPMKLSSDFWEFNTSLFEQKKREWKSEKFAKDNLENMTIPEYIEEVKARM